MVAGLTCPGVQRQPTLAGSKMMGYSRTMCGPIVCMYPVPGTGFRSADPAEGIPHQVPEAVEVKPCPHECVHDRGQGRTQRADSLGDLRRCQGLVGQVKADHREGQPASKTIAAASG